MWRNSRLRRLAGRLARRVGLRPPLPVPGPVVVAMPAPVVAESAAGPVRLVDLYACTVFFGFIRLRGAAHLADGSDASQFNASFVVDGVAPAQRCTILERHAGGIVSFAVEALVDRSRPVVEAGEMRITCGGAPSVFAVTALLPGAQTRDLRSLMPEFQQATRDLAAAEGRRPRMLDLGGRARSGQSFSIHFPECDVTVFDIQAAPEVDVVGDAHAMSQHFPAETFDFVLSVSVFEHLLMPWKVAIEMGRVMRTGGIAMVHTHQTEGVHDMPWDFLRFSDTAWAGIFNRATGFEVIRTDMSRLMHVIPAVVLLPLGDNDNAGGYQCSTVLVRKIGPPSVEWDVKLDEVVASAYPTGGG